MHGAQLDLVGAAVGGASADPADIGVACRVHRDVPTAGELGRVLQDAAEFAGGWDVAMDAAGNAYIGWIGGSATDSSTNEVQLCTVHPGTSSCAGGIQSVSPIAPSTSDGLHVLVTPGGAVTLIWSHNAVVPTYGGRDSHIAEAT